MYLELKNKDIKLKLKRKSKFTTKDEVGEYYADL
jgi:hypothetical protein